MIYFVKSAFCYNNITFGKNFFDKWICKKKNETKQKEKKKDR